MIKYIPATKNSGLDCNNFYSNDNIMITSLPMFEKSQFSAT